MAAVVETQTTIVTIQPSSRTVLRAEFHQLARGSVVVIDETLVVNGRNTVDVAVGSVLPTFHTLRGDSRDVGSLTAGLLRRGVDRTVLAQHHAHT